MTHLINLLFKVKITDSQSGFRALKREKLQNVNLTATEYEIETEMLLKAIKKGLKIAEVGVVRDKRKSGSSQFKRIRNGFRILLWILKERFST